MSNIATTEPYIAQLATTPFRWGWDSNHWAPWMLHYPLWPPKKTRRMLQLQLTKPPGSLSGSNTYTNRFRISYKSLMTSTSSTMINIRCHISFKWETKCGYTLQKEYLTGPHRKLHPLCYGPYTITKDVGDNYFELNIPPFLFLHPVFNVALLRPYFLPP